MTWYNFPAIPPQLAFAGPFLKVASEHETSDPVVAYWCRLIAAKRARKIKSLTQEAKDLLQSLSNYLQKTIDAVAKLPDKHIPSPWNNMECAEEHIESYACKLYHWGDTNDRASIFDENVVMAFATSAVLFDLLEYFARNKLCEEYRNKRQYAKLKAAYIQNCLKKGETPIAGPSADMKNADVIIIE